MDWNLSHETFNVAELIEAGVAYKQATGKSKLLECAIRAADNMLDTFNPDGIKMAPGHAVVEMALVRLYELTGQQKYLDGCKFFLDCRGIRKFDPNSNDMRVNGKYWQDHLPAAQQRTAEGHAVRALYFYSGMADWVRYSNDSAYETAVNAIWDNIAHCKTYITGGFGARDNNESFGVEYELPNNTAYSETCAALAAAMFNRRMFCNYGHAKYMDMAELALYNTVLDGYGIEGKTFYYPNRLETGADVRSQWFGTSCCPTNICRIIPSVPGYAYATSANSLYVNLYINSTATAQVGDNKVNITTTTQYPYDGVVKIDLDGTVGDLRLRIPGWATNNPIDGDLYTFVNDATPYKIEIDGAPASYSMENGYAVIPGAALQGHSLVLTLPMEARALSSHPEVKTNENLLAYMRGPIVYCAEGADNGGSVANIYAPRNAEISVGEAAMPELFHGNMPYLKLKGSSCVYNGKEPQISDAEIKLIPYFARAYRGNSPMKVWLPENQDKIEQPINFYDEVIICNDESERAHSLNGSNMQTGPENGGWRVSYGGYMEFEMNVLPDAPCDLVLKMWGGDGGNRRFNIQCDGTTFSYEELNEFCPGQHYYMRHAIPYELTKGKSKVKIRMNSIDGSSVGGLFGVYTALSENYPENTVPLDWFWSNKLADRESHAYKGNGGMGDYRNHTWMDGWGAEGQSFTMKIDPTNRNYLMLLYWGAEWDMRDFDIYVNDGLVANQKLQNNYPGRYFFVTYPIPEECTSGKTEARVHLTSPAGTKTGGFMYAYTLSTPGTSALDKTVLNTMDKGDWYTLTGIKVENPAAGMYVYRCGASVAKVVLP